MLIRWRQWHDRMYSANAIVALVLSLSRVIYRWWWFLYFDIKQSLLKVFVFISKSRNIKILDVVVYTGLQITQCSCFILNGSLNMLRKQREKKIVVVVSLRCGSKFKKYLTLDQRWSELFENGTKTEKKLSRTPGFLFDVI